MATESVTKKMGDLVKSKGKSDYDAYVEGLSEKVENLYTAVVNGASQFSNDPTKLKKQLRDTISQGSQYAWKDAQETKVKRML